jgi:hypothetical protein
MKGQLRSYGWPLQGGRSFIPAGQIIDTDAGTDAWSRLVVALGITAPPVNMQPFDQSTYDLMRLEFPAYRIITVTGPAGDGIVRT